MSKVVLFIKTRCKPGKRDEVFALWEKHLKPRLMENDFQENYAYCYDNFDPNVFYLFEVYSSQEDFDNNSKKPFFGEYMQEAGPLLDGEPDFGMASPVFTKGLG